MTGFTTQDNDDLGSNKIARSPTAFALYENPIAIAQRDPSAPWLNGIGAMTVLASGSGNFTVPDGVYRIKVTACGGGGGGGAAGTAATSGTATTFGTITCNGGAGGSTGAGGTASGGTINIDGQSGSRSTNASCAVGGTPAFGLGIGGKADDDGTVSGAARNGSGYGAGGGAVFTSSLEYGGGAGGASMDILSVEPGDLIAYSVGTGGSGQGSQGGDGTGGIIIIEY